MLGPHFHKPAAPRVSSYTETPLPRHTVKTHGAGHAGKAQTFVPGKDIPADWWYLFHSKELNFLIQQALANNQQLAAAYATLRSAQETLNAQIGNSFFPAVDAALSAQRQRAVSGGAGSTSSPQVFNLFNASVNVSYTLDIFGGQRRQVEALRAQVDFQQFELIAAYMSLTANVVTTAVTIASLEAQLNATRDLLRAQESQLHIFEKQQQLGGVSMESVLAQQTLVNQTRATLFPLEKSLSQTRHALAVLVGAFPNQTFPKIHLDRLQLPKHLPVSFPSQLVRQRPDIRASEALLHAASANIGVATANLFPSLTLSASDGWQALVPSQLFKPSSHIWSIGGALAQPIFHGGALFSQRRNAIALYDQAGAQYRQVVLQAFQNVADTLKALEIDAKTLHAQQRAEKSAQKYLTLVHDQYRLGGQSYLALLTAQQQYQTSRIARIQAQAARYVDTAALFQALGGGWWHKEWCVKECL